MCISIFRLEVEQKEVVDTSCPHRPSIIFGPLLNNELLPVARNGLFSGSQVLFMLVHNVKALTFSIINHLGLLHIFVSFENSGQNHYHLRIRIRRGQVYEPLHYLDFPLKFSRFSLVSQFPLSIQVQICNAHIYFSL